MIRLNLHTDSQKSESPQSCSSVGILLCCCCPLSFISRLHPAICKCSKQLYLLQQREEMIRLSPWQFTSFRIRSETDSLYIISSNKKIVKNRYKTVQNRFWGVFFDFLVKLPVKPKRRYKRFWGHSERF